MPPGAISSSGKAELWFSAGKTKQISIINSAKF
jgi:hypothetical protein